MGWTPDEEIITIDFTGTRFEGLTVKVEDVNMGDLLEMVTLSASLREGEGAGDAFGKLVAMAGSMLAEWDMEFPAGNPLPPTSEGLLKLKQRVALPLIEMILKAIQNVKGDLKKDLSSGLPFPAGSIPMEPL